MIRSGFNKFNQEVQMAIADIREHLPPTSDEMPPTKQAKSPVLKARAQSTNQVSTVDAVKPAGTDMTDQNAGGSILPGSRAKLFGGGKHSFLYQTGRKSAKRPKLSTPHTSTSSHDQVSSPGAKATNTTDSNKANPHASSSDGVRPETASSEATNSTTAGSRDAVGETMHALEKSLGFTITSFSEVCENLVQLQQQMDTKDKSTQGELDRLQWSNDGFADLLRHTSQAHGAVVADLKAQVSRLEGEAVELNKTVESNKSKVARYDTLRSLCKKLQREAEEEAEVWNHEMGVLTDDRDRLLGKTHALQYDIDKLKAKDERYTQLAGLVMSVHRAQTYGETGKAVDDLKKCVTELQKKAASGDTAAMNLL